MEAKPKHRTAWIAGIVVLAVLTTLALVFDILVFGILWF